MVTLEASCRRYCLLAGCRVTYHGPGSFIARLRDSDTWEMEKALAGLIMSVVDVEYQHMQVGVSSSQGQPGVRLGGREQRVGEGGEVSANRCPLDAN